MKLFKLHIQQFFEIYFSERVREEVRADDASSAAADPQKMDRNEWLLKHIA